MAGALKAQTDEVCKQIQAARRVYTCYADLLVAIGEVDAAKECQRVVNELQSAMDEAKYFRWRVESMRKSKMEAA